MPNNNYFSPKSQEIPSLCHLSRPVNTLVHMIDGVRKYFFFDLCI